ncbi:RES family NAD+ phosphorylase [Neoroseomonas eburnea]|uniref:RES family NAD+ phosphorylase n=1 Tax=Neoroseomonas eburnea TaxID=1346889 RepID=UPI00235126C9|nr:RES family NAD+ phosphorylase [Neoroseomonas eburnea]
MVRRPFADLSGEGARRFGGRWNSPGRRVVYFADHPALAVLEVRVHLDLPPDLLPADYVLLRVALPGPVEVLETLPEDPRTVGDAWLAEARSPVLSVPSVIVPAARNLLLNPTHPAADRARIESIDPFAFDPRLWLGIS